MRIMNYYTGATESDYFEMNISIVCCIIVTVLFAISIIGWYLIYFTTFKLVYIYFFYLFYPGIVLYCAYRVKAYCSRGSKYINNLTDLVKVFEDV